MDERKSDDLDESKRRFALTPNCKHLIEEGPSSEAARSSDGGDESRECGHDDFHRDFKDFFLFVVHSVEILKV